MKESNETRLHEYAAISCSQELFYACSTLLQREGPRCLVQTNGDSSSRIQDGKGIVKIGEPVGHFVVWFRLTESPADLNSNSGAGTALDSRK